MTSWGILENMSTTEATPLLKTHKIRLRPNVRQRVYFAQACGFKRVVWNHALADLKESLDNGAGWRSPIELNNRFNAAKYERYPWCRRLSQNIVPNTIILNLGSSFRNFREKRARFPKWKRKKQGHDSFRADLGGQGVRVDDKRVRLPKIGWVRMWERLRFEGKIISATVSRTADWWYISITVDVSASEPPLPPNGGPSVGVDVGLKDLAILAPSGEHDDAYAVANLRPLQRALRKLRRLNKAIARSRNIHGKQCRSKRRDRLYRQRARLYARITFRRQEMHHQATTAITKQYGLIGVEDLQVKGLIRNKKLARHIADVGWGEFLRQVEYKAEWYGSAVVKAVWSYPSTQTCSACGFRHQGAEKLSLKVRRFVCPQCGWLCDRDVNAALNLRHYALNEVAHRLGETQNGHGGLTNSDAGVVETPLPAPGGKRDEVSTATPALPAEYAQGVLLP